MTLARPAHPTLAHAAIEGRRLRHLLWNGYAKEAWQALQSIQNWSRRIFEFADRILRPYAKKLWGHCTDLKTYVANSEAAIIDYSRRHLSMMPVPSSAADPASTRSPTHAWPRGSGCGGHLAVHIGS